MTYRSINGPRDTRANVLLDALSEAEWERLRGQLKPVAVRVGDSLYESSVRIDRVYFPTTSTVALLCELADGASAGIAVVGNEGLVGIAQFLDGGATESRAVVQSAGCAYELPAALLTDECARGGAMPRALRRYTQALMTQIEQTAVCNRFHSIDQRLCRWLLMSLDRGASPDLSSTHESIALMLGVRREGVSEAASKLQKAGAIRCQRGQIRVLDRGRLEANCCECYEVVKREYDRLLGATCSVLSAAA